MVRIDMVTSHVETLLERITQTERLDRDDAGDWQFPLDHDADMTVGILANEQRPVVWVRAFCAGAVQPSLRLFIDLNEVNQNAVFCRVSWQDGFVTAEAEVVASTLDEDELSTAFYSVIRMSDRINTDYLTNWLAQSTMSFGSDT